MSETNQNVQSYPAFDSPPTDPFEALVAAYYQNMGYLTSSAKWFWVHNFTKHQGGYQDIDVLAVNGKETVIVSVSGNLDDKIRFTRTGELNAEILSRQLEYFSRVYDYLKNVEAYKWLVDNRQKRHVIAYAHGKPLGDKLEADENWRKYNIDLLYAGQIVDELRSRLKKSEQPLKTNNQIVKVLQIITWLENDKTS